jgi:TonB family protein
VKAQTNPRPIKIAVLDFSETSTGKLASEKVATTLRSIPSLSVVDRDLARAAALGAHYTGSLNLELSAARDLGAAIGCDFFVLGESQTVRRSPSTGSVYFESYAAAFLVSARSGKLIAWERPNVKDSTSTGAERLLLDLLGKDETRQRYLIALQKAQEDERHEREVAVARDTPVIEEGSDESDNDKRNFRPPRPYRRLRPIYPESAAVADAEGTVDVLVELDQNGEVKQVEVERWAGFGLDEATVSTVRQLHFSPAIRDGIAIPIRVLLRYNFRQPAK